MQATGRAAPLSRPAPLLASVAAVVIVLDQVTKLAVVATMEEGQTIPILDGVLHWTFVRNPGAAFSLFTEVPWLFTILASLVSVWIIRQAPRLPDRGHAIVYGAILGGALGNLIDRFIRSPAPFRGHVVDFIDLRVWPIFNIADMGVTLGAIALVLVGWRAERRSAA